MDSAGEEPITLRSKLKHVDNQDNDLVTMINNEEELNEVGASANIGSVDNICINGSDYQKNPLENPLVISHIFSLLNLADIKHCRLVCNKWNDLAIPLVEKMSIAIIGSSNHPSDVPGRTLTSFKNVAENSMISYQSVKLNSSPGCRIWWSFRALEEFLQSQDVRDLTIDNIKVRRQRNRPELFIINGFISDNLTHLSILNTRSSHSFTVSTENLTAPISLSFKNCRLDIVENRLLAPRKLEMVDVEIFQQKWWVNSIFVNEILTFENLKELKLSSMAVHASKLSINLASNITVDNLFLDDVNVQNFYESKWCITKKLTLRKIPFRNPTHMKFTELDFGGSTINLNSLSESIEKLTLDMTGDNMHIIQQPGVLSLRNLKYLELLAKDCSFCWYCPHESNVEERSTAANFSPLRILNLFGSCLNLTTVKLQAKCFDVPDLRLNTSWIPRSVRNLFLFGEIRAFGDIFKLEHLVIQDKSSSDWLTSTLDRLQSKHIVWTFQEMTIPKLEKLTLFLSRRSFYESAAIGFSSLNMRNFKKSLFPQYFREEFRYYLFKNGKGRGIQEAEYANLLKQSSKL